MRPFWKRSDALVNVFRTCSDTLLYFLDTKRAFVNVLGHVAIRLLSFFHVTCSDALVNSFLTRRNALVEVFWTRSDALLKSAMVLVRSRSNLLLQSSSTCAYPLKSYSSAAFVLNFPKRSANAKLRATRAGASSGQKGRGEASKNLGCACRAKKKLQTSVSLCVSI